MERKELKEILIEKGVDEKLLEMPAILEPIFLKVLNNEMTVSRIQKNACFLVPVPQDGTFWLDGRNIDVCDDGTVLIKDKAKEGITKINLYGIEESYREED